MLLRNQSRASRLGVRAMAFTSILAALTLAWVPAALSQESTASGASLSIIATNDAAEWGAELGSEVIYEFTVTNTGDATVNDIVVVDTICGDVGAKDALYPGDAISFTKTVVITGTGQGSATALGRGPDGEVVSASVGHTVEVFVAHEWLDYSVAIGASAEYVSPGGLVEVTAYVDNISDEPGGSGDVQLKLLLDTSVAELVSIEGGEIEGGTAVWVLDGPGPAEPPISRSVTIRARPSASGGDLVRIDAAILIDPSRTDIDPSNDQESLVLIVGEGGTTPASVAGSSDTPGPEPFLPFTGAPEALLVFSGVFGLCGYWLRRLAQ